MNRNQAKGTAKDVAVAVTVTSGPPVAVERPLYFAADPGLGAAVDGGTVVRG